MAENCIFCSIVQEVIPSYKVGENKDSVSVLEINPISKGHLLVIPKKHSQLREKIPMEISNAIQDLSKRVIEEFSPKDMLVAKTGLFGHDVINLIPVYSDENLKSSRHNATKQELESVQRALLAEKIQGKGKVEKKKEPVKRKPRTKKVSEKNTWLPRRIP